MGENNRDLENIVYVSTSPIQLSLSSLWSFMLIASRAPALAQQGRSMKRSSTMIPLFYAHCLLCSLWV
jgi:hypothetical protein